MSTPSTIGNKPYYRGLNRRFDRRAALLKRLGFRYIVVPVNLPGAGRSDTQGMFARNIYGRVQSIPAATLHYADVKAWNDTLRNVLR